MEIPNCERSSVRTALLIVKPTNGAVVLVVAGIGVGVGVEVATLIPPVDTSTTSLAEETT